MSRVGAHLFSVTIDLATPPPLGPSSPDQSTQVEHIDDRLSVCAKLLMVDLLHTCRKWVVWLWWGCDGMSLCAFWCCPVHCLWTFPGEWASLRSRVVLLWVCSGPSLLAKLPVR